MIKKAFIYLTFTIIFSACTNQELNLILSQTVHQVKRDLTGAVDKKYVASIMTGKSYDSMTAQEQKAIAKKINALDEESLRQINSLNSHKEYEAYTILKLADKVEKMKEENEAKRKAKSYNETAKKYKAEIDSKNKGVPDYVNTNPKEKAKLSKPALQYFEILEGYANQAIHQSLTTK